MIHHKQIRIGKNRKISCQEAIMKYYNLAQEDEEVGLLLIRQDKHRHGIYFLLQSMEKYLRANIYMLINPCNKHIVNQNRHHSIDEAVKLLLSIISSDSLVKNQIQTQLNEVLGNINYIHLHNNLRYPSFSLKDKKYFSLEVNESDSKEIIKILNLLKEFLKDFHKINNL